MEDTRPTGAAGSKRYVPGLFSAVRRKGRGGEGRDGEGREAKKERRREGEGEEGRK